MPVTLVASVDRLSVEPEVASRLALSVTVRAAAAAARKPREPLRTVLALDVSSSMAGEPLAHVVRSVDRLLDALGPEDELGVVAFSDEARIVVELARCDAAGKRLVRSRVARLATVDRTNIEAGLRAAVELLDGAAGRGAVLLLSDGAPNVGAYTEDSLRDVVRGLRPRASIAALGYGLDHAEQILAMIGEAGGGGYEYVPDPATCARGFARALGAQADVVGSGLELRIAPAEGVELARFYGREDTRFGRDGVTVSLPDLVNDAERIVACEVRLRAPRDRFLAGVAHVRLTGAVEGRPLDVGEEVVLEIAERPPSPCLAGLAAVLLVRADEARDQARALADRGQFTAAALLLQNLAAEIAQCPAAAADGRLGEAHALLSDEAAAFGKQPSAESYAQFRKATVASRLAAPMPSRARSRGDASQKLVEHVAGALPTAWLVVGEARHRLREECIIGRTGAADLQVIGRGVSRRHAEIFANAGAFWLADLGSTSPTVVNGLPLGHAPHKLVAGDVVIVGDVALRYVEEGG